MAHVSKREEFNKHLEDARKEGGPAGVPSGCEPDTPFMPEPKFGPRAKGECAVTEDPPPTSHLPLSAQAISSVALSSPFSGPHAAHPCPSVDSGLAKA